MPALEELHAIEPTPIWEGVIVRAVHGDRLTLGVVELAPGAIVPEHHHDNEQLGLVLSGRVMFTIGGETRELGPGGTWRIASDVPHRVVAGPSGAVVVDVFAPRREDWLQAETQACCPPLWPDPS